MSKSIQLQEIGPGDVQFDIQNHDNSHSNFDEQFKNIPPQYGPRGYEQPKDYTPMPKKIIIICLFLLIVGIGFLIGGFVDYFIETGEKWRGIMFLVIGSLLFIPGIYYSYFLFEAYRASSPEERQQILDEIPMEQDY